MPNLPDGNANANAHTHRHCNAHCYCYFSMTVPAGATVTGLLNGLSVDYDLYLYRAGSTTAVAQSTNGGTTFTDSLGQSWAADKAFATGSWGYSTGSSKSSSAAVGNTTDDLLYQKYRELAGEYRFTVPNGNYNVTLKFAEFAYASPTDRTMKITLESTVVEAALNIYAVAGLNTAHDRTYSIAVTDGVLNIIFAKGPSAGRTPEVNAIWVRGQ